MTEEQKSCPRCGQSGPVDEMFGLRTMRRTLADGTEVIEERAQSWCKACRSGAPADRDVASSEGDLEAPPPSAAGEPASRAEGQRHESEVHMGQSEIAAFLDELGDEGGASLRALLQRAYERGFREGLSAAGAPAPMAALAPPAPSPTATPIALPAHPEPAAVAWDEEPEGEDDDPASKDEPARPIMVHATIGTLMRRIERTFALERFDIDVFVCRRGDRDRRQLKSTVRLKNYLRER